MAQRGWTYAADLLLSESVREAVTRRRVAVAALASMWRSMLASRRGELASAAEQARQAAMYSAETSDPAQRALVAASAGQLGAGADSQAAIQQVTNTIRFFQTAGNRAWLPQLLRQRALLHRRDGDLAAAEADFRQAIEISEETLDGAAPAMMRDGFTTDARSSYEDLIRLLLDRGASRDALAYAERARLLGQSRRNDRARDVLAPLAAIAPGTTAVVYEVQADALTAWLVTRESIAVFRSRDARDIERRLGSAADASPTMETLATLYDFLMRDWITQVAPDSHLVIVPPPALAGVPFSALFDRQRQRFLIDDYVVAVAPSLASAAEAFPVVSRDDALLIVGDPAYQRLPRLPESREEARAVAAMYMHAKVLLEEEATVGHLLPQIAGAVIFHFAGHAVADGLAPELSSLMLAGDERLYLHELLARRLPLKLVVLSACSTAAGRTAGARGTLDLAHAFVDRGVRAVVGTLRPVPDSDAAMFSIEFHRALTRSEDIAEAVRSAQLQMKSRAKGDLTWAAFCLMKGKTHE